MVTSSATRVSTVQTSADHILVVDHDPVIRRSLADALWGAGFQCAVAACAEEALIRLRQGDYAVMLCEVGEEVSGAPALLCQALMYDPNLVVVMMPAHANLSSALDGIQAGAFDYVARPFQLREVELTVRRALEHHRLRRENRRHIDHLEDLVEQRTRQVRENAINTISSLSLALEPKDQWTHDHSRRVSELVSQLGGALGLTDMACADLRLAGLLLDIGKIGVETAVLLKPGPLTEAEYAHIKQHPVLGATILAPIHDLSHLVPFIRGHHERWDGSGYPDRLAGEAIPFGARIMAVADAYVAMREGRPYRAGLTKHWGLRELRLGVDLQFDVDIVGVFLDLDQQGALDSFDEGFPEAPTESLVTRGRWY